MKPMLVNDTMKFEKRCKIRVIVGAVISIFGMISLYVAYCYGNGLLSMIAETEHHADFIHGFYTGCGGGLIGAGIATIVNNLRILKNGDLKKKQQVIENDERNQMISRTCWAYAGYGLFIFLYAAIMVAGMISFEILVTLLIVLAVYGLLLLVIYTVLRKIM